MASRAGAPSSVATPPSSANALAAIAGATSGTTARLTIGETIAKPAERHEDDRKRRRLGRERNGEAFDEPARQASPCRRRQPRA